MGHADSNDGESHSTCTTHALMTFIRICLALTCLLMMVGHSSAQYVQLETEVLEPASVANPYAANYSDQESRPLAGDESRSFAGEESIVQWGTEDSANPAQAHIGDMPMHGEMPMHDPAAGQWDSHAVAEDTYLPHADVMYGDDVMQGDMHAMDDLSHAPTACNCGDSKHCHGVCLDPGRPAKPKIDKPGDWDWGDCPPYRYRMDDCKRAGNPHCVARWAKCSVTEKYSSWFVGGGAAFFRGRCRRPSEGTWGLDYDGCFGYVNNWLTYTRGRKQGGEGAYRTDGEPKIVTRTHEFLGLGH